MTGMSSDQAAHMIVHTGDMWHGLDPGPDPPRHVHAFIEITPFDLVKYEVDKDSGYLRVDRSQRTSSLPPASAEMHFRQVTPSKTEAEGKNQ